MWLYVGYYALVAVVVALVLVALAYSTVFYSH